MDGGSGQEIRQGEEEDDRYPESTGDAESGSRGSDSSESARNKTKTQRKQAGFRET
jgi:hypothetical protein